MSTLGKFWGYKHRAVYMHHKSNKLTLVCWIIFLFLVVKHKVLEFWSHSPLGNAIIPWPKCFCVGPKEAVVGVRGGMPFVLRIHICYRCAPRQVWSAGTFEREPLSLKLEYGPWVVLCRHWDVKFGTVPTDNKWCRLLWALVPKRCLNSCSK